MKNLFYVLFALLLLVPAVSNAQYYSGTFYPPLATPFTGGTLTSTLTLPAGTAAAPSLTFTGSAGYGLAMTTSTILGVYVGGSTRIADFRDTGVYFPSATAGVFFGAGPYSALYSPASNVLEQRMTTNAQTFNIYNTYTDGSNYERAQLGWSGNYFYIRPQAAGSGTKRDLVIGDLSSGGVVYIQSGSGAGLINVQFDGVGGKFAPATDDASYTFGGSSAKWSTAYFSRSIQGSKSKTIADAVATEFVRVSIPQTAGANYAAGNVEYTVMARKGSDIQVLHGDAKFSCINAAGTESCSTVIEADKTAAVVTAGTLTCAITMVTGLTDEVGIAANCNTSLTATLDGLTIQYRLDMPQPNTVTPQ